MEMAEPIHQITPDGLHSAASGRLGRVRLVTARSGTQKATGSECGWRTQTGDLGPPSARSRLPRSSFRAKRPSRLAHLVVQQGWINLVSPSWLIRLRHVIKVFRIATGMSRNLELLKTFLRVAHRRSRTSGRVWFINFR